MAEQRGKTLSTLSRCGLLRGCIHTQGRCGIPADSIHPVQGLSLIHLGRAEQEVSTCQQSAVSVARSGCCSCWQLGLHHTAEGGRIGPQCGQVGDAAPQQLGAGFNREQLLQLAIHWPPLILGQLLAAYHLLARDEGLFVEPASAASVAGLLKAVEDGWVRPGSTVVCTVTGHGLKDPDTALRDVAPVTALPVEPAAVAAALGLD